MQDRAPAVNVAVCLARLNQFYAMYDKTLSDCHIISIAGPLKLEHFFLKQLVSVHSRGLHKLALSSH
jgi:hypothetical protein